MFAATKSIDWTHAGIAALTVDACMSCVVEKLYQYTCDWNYRPDHCMYMSNCKSAEQHGVSMLHGCRRAFHVDKWPVFRAVYQTIDNVRRWSSLVVIMPFVCLSVCPSKVKVMFVGHVCGSC